MEVTKVAEVEELKIKLKLKLKKYIIDKFGDMQQFENWLREGGKNNNKLHNDLMHILLNMHHLDPLYYKSLLYRRSKNNSQISEEEISEEEMINKFLKSIDIVTNQDVVNYLFDKI